MRLLRVKKQHQPPSTPPLLMKEGDSLRGEKRETKWDGWLWCTNGEGISAWVPAVYLTEGPETGMYWATRDYNSFELEVQVGEKVTVQDEVASWAWVCTNDGNEGWVPFENLEYILD